MTIQQFRRIIYGYYARHKREMPWRNSRNPYHILISEIMLQQTQVNRVREKYGLFIRAFPSFQVLSEASLQAVLRMWQGLGYNRRALLLKTLAREVVVRYNNVLPPEKDILKTLPGIGAATAGAICAFAYNQPVIFIETNIRSVFIHFFFKQHRDVSDAQLVPWIEKTLDRKNPREWYYALMDYGVYLKTIFPNPSRKSRLYTRQKRFEGSDRQIRGKIIKTLLSHPRLMEQSLYKLVCLDKRRGERIVRDLKREGFIKQKGKQLCL